MPDYPLPPGVAERRLSVHTCGLEIPAALTLPEGRAPASAILLIPGSLFSDINGDFPSWNVFPGANVSLAHQLAERGHAVWRYAKSGPGTGTRVLDETEWARHRTWDGRVTVARAHFDAMKAALAASGFGAAPVGVAGHSEGAVVALRLAPVVSPVAGVITFAGPASGILTIMREQMERSLPPEKRQETLAAFDRGIEYVRRGEPIPVELRHVEGLGGLAMLPLDPTRYLAHCDATDPCAEAAMLDVPLLVVQGGRDANVTANDAERLVAAHQPKPTALLLVPEVSHMFKVVPDGMSQMEMFGLPGPCDPRVADGVDAWVRSL